MKSTRHVWATAALVSHKRSQDLSKNSRFNAYLYLQESEGQTIEVCCGMLRSSQVEPRKTKPLSGDPRWLSAVQPMVTELVSGSSPSASDNASLRPPLRTPMTGNGQHAKGGLARLI
eukprot:3473700-Amphidinium_carterae.1